MQSVRKLKALGIETQFLTANMTSMGNSVLTIFGALAQKESANTSKRIKFGKKVNAEKGRVPNIVYGYDKTIGDYFNLSINEEETKVIHQMFTWYTEEGYGGAKIANMLNDRGIKIKRGKEYCELADHGYKILAEAVEADRVYDIKCPVLLLCGEKDAAGSAKSYNRRWEKQDEHTLIWLADAGHNANTDVPKKVNQIIDEFVCSTEKI